MGFTLIELMVVIAVISVLSKTVVPFLPVGWVDTSRIYRCEKTVGYRHTCVDFYKMSSFVEIYKNPKGDFKVGNLSIWCYVPFDYEYIEDFLKMCEQKGYAVEPRSTSWCYIHMPEKFSKARTGSWWASDYDTHYH